jgi:Zn-finger nucleic acid-binding protein
MNSLARNTIGCDRCGGTTRTGEGQSQYICQYCSSMIQLSDISMDRVLPAGHPTDCQCPSCDGMLQTGLMEGHRVLYCSDCFGLLLAHADFGRIVEQRQARRAGFEPVEPRPIDDAAFHRQLHCPGCGDPMESHPYYGPGNIVIDTCTPCGYLWLDHGELTRVEQSAKPASVHALRDAEADRLSTGAAEPSTIDEEMEPRSLMRVLADLLF